MFKHITRYSWILCAALLWGGMQPAMANNVILVPPDLIATPVWKVMSLVENAARRIREDGAEQAIEAANSGEFRDGDLYLFMMDSKGTIVAHPVSQELIGKTADEIFDANRQKFIPRMLAVASSNPEGGWVDYYWRVPDTQRIVFKLSYVVMRDGYLLGAGMYFPAE